MIRVAVRVTNKNLHTNKICLDKTHMSAYYQGLVSSLLVLTEDNVFVEEYYGYGLQKLIESAEDTGKGYLLAERSIKKGD